jgi:hypothetical protein
MNSANETKKDNEMSKALKILIAITFLYGTAISAGQAATLTLDPVNGEISGAPGDTLGWGFTITNDTDFLVITSAEFDPSSAVGTFTDFISADNFIVVGPSPESTSVSQPFDQTALTGVGSFAISPSALPGDTATGQIVLTYDLFSVSPNDPNFDPDFDLITTDNTLSANASVIVAGRAAVPEPRGTALMVIALLLVALGHQTSALVQRRARAQ